MIHSSMMSMPMMKSTTTTTTIKILFLLVTISSILLKSTTNAKTITKLTKENWDESTKAKSLFVKFCTKTCTHCQEIKIPWQVLEEEYEQNDNVVIGTVDCDVETKLCADYNVVGTPTLLYGERNSLKEYAGDTSFAKLNKWTKEMLLNPICSPENLHVCNDIDRSRLESWITMSVEEIEQMIQSIHDDEKNAQLDHDTNMDKLQKIYDDLNNALVLYKAAIEREIKLLKSVLETKRK